VSRPIPDAAVQLGIESEGVKLKSYQDSTGKWTIGVGHLITPHDHYGPNSVITRQEAIDLYKADLAFAGAQVEHLVKVPLNDNQFAALIDFTFNEGSGSLAGSTLLKVLNKGDYQKAAGHFAEWNKALNPKTGKLEPLRGLTARRKAEADLFLS
jgi:lysozyme